ncbi:MAG: methylmalonyl Co-A mutase-associated GTPase MeaB [bacterium]
MAEKELNINNLVKRFNSGDRTACARMISMMENGSPDASELFNAVYHKVGRAHRIGITGPPGAGKSTMVEKLTLKIREKGNSAAIVAVDPSSPFSGGAILGDRIRMSKLFLDPEVFIRSMATRGSLGGISSKTRAVCDLLDAFGKDIIIIETVGVGQAELDVVMAAHTTIVTLVPESGDGIQAMKAGLMEIGNLFVINKSDRDGADQLYTEIEMMLDMLPDTKKWRPKIFQTIAKDDKGIDTLLEGVNDHYQYMKEHNLLMSHKEENIKSGIMQELQDRLSDSLHKNSDIKSIFDASIKQVCNGKITPGDVVEEMWNLLQR